MIDIIKEIFAGQQYTKVNSNVPYVSLFVRYEESSAKVIQFINCINNVGMSQQQFIAFCNKAKAFIITKGYEEIDFISIIVTTSIMESRKLAFCNENCWIIDENSGRLVIYENQPSDFDGLKKRIEGRIRPINENNPFDYHNDFKNTSVADSESKKDVGLFKEGNLREVVTPINTIIVVLNVLVFAILNYFGSTEDALYMAKNGAMFVPAVINKGEYYRFLTSMFLHFGFSHLSGNMVVLLFLGDNVERAAGRFKYLIIYFGGGLIASFGSFLYSLVYNRGIVSAGASGAIFALIGALLWFVIKNRGRLEDFTVSRLCLLIFYSLYNGFRSEHVDNAAHIFGLLGGFLIAICIYRKAE